MATILLSRHSSNPLDVGSSDARNKVYLHRYMEAEARRAIEASASSEDPIHGYHPPELDKYHSHLSHLFPGLSVPPQHRPIENRHGNAFVDLDQDMESDDELCMLMNPDNEDEDEESGEHTDDDTSGGGDTDAQGETDEEMTIHRRSPEEREQIEEEIADLEDAVPQLTVDYKIVDRLGTGTFSSVYKAIDLGYHGKWDNLPWQGHHCRYSSAYYQSAQLPRESKAFVAIKRIYVTSSPERIRNEIAIMQDCRACRHVSQLITAFRQDDQVVAIMPYHRNEDFRDFYRTLPMPGIQAYFRCMFRALRDIHARGIIHRDVKPANFLFDPRTGIGTLCDFGLACRMEPGPSHGACLHTPPSKDSPHGRIRNRNELDMEHLKKMQKEARMKSGLPSEKVGYPAKDTRPSSKANRAGTRGFRSPEVLLKCGEQTGAIDVWSAGMILLFFLCGKFPLFQSTDDIEALMEIATIIGRKRMEKAATLHSRTFATNVPSITQDGISWRSFIEKQNPELYTPPDPEPRFFPYSTQTHMNAHIPPSSSSSPPHPSRSSSHAPNLSPPSPESHSAAIESAFTLLEQLLQPESTRRMTPRAALYHPFLACPDEIGDDHFFPHPFGEGVCGEWHFKDDVTEEARVKVGLFGEPLREGDGEGGYEVRTLLAGEGIAIGREPCEFHRPEFGY